MKEKNSNEKRIHTKTQREREGEDWLAVFKIHVIKQCECVSSDIYITTRTSNNIKPNALALVDQMSKK